MESIMYRNTRQKQSPKVSNKETDVGFQSRYKDGMKEWVQQAIAFKAGEDRGAQSRVAELLAAEFGWLPGRVKLNKLSTGRQVLSAADMYAISKVTGYPVPASATGDQYLDSFMKLYATASETARQYALEAASLYLKRHTS